jgi:hypothetical protein
MEEVQLKYGDATLTLKKSSTIVGVKPKRTGMQEVERAASRFGSDSLSQTLGDFRMIDVQRSVQPMEETLDAIRLDPDIVSGTHVYYTSDDEVPFVPTGELYLVFKDSAQASECQKVIDEYALEVVETSGERELTVRVTPNSPNPIKVAASLQQLPVVMIAEPDLATPGKLAAFILPSDTLMNRQWHLLNPGRINGSSIGLKTGADARVIAAWESAQSVGSPNVIVAVIDDGFDLSHPDLSGVGKIIAPWDFTRNSPNPLPEFSNNYPNLDPRTRQWVGDWHGTACAGVAIGSVDGAGILGAAPASRFMPVRWGTDLSDTQVAAWFNHVRTQGAAVVSCSWGAAAKVFRLSSRIKGAITQCATTGRGGKGCVICFAAGNDDQDIQDPSGAYLNGFAIHPDVIAVAACTSRDEKSNYSNFGDSISICAPSSGVGGRGIMTADVIGTFTRNGRQIESGYSPGAFTESFGGTSSATPLVAGICALLLSIDPNLTAKQIKALIETTARRIGSPASYNATGHSPKFGYGCIDADAAVKKLISGQPAPSSSGMQAGRGKARKKNHG